MKIRNGFVSNSSSSSFVVELHKWDDTTPDYLISKQQINVLINSGFKFYDQYYTTLLYGRVDDLMEIKELPSPGEQLNDKLISAYTDVVCNQWDILEILIQHKIPFLASIHNDDHLYVWDGKTDYINCFTNFCNMYVPGNMNTTINYLKSYKPYFKLDLKGQQIENDETVTTILTFFELKQKLNTLINNYFTKDELEKINTFFNENKKNILKLLKN